MSAAFSGQHLQGLKYVCGLMVALVCVCLPYNTTCKIICQHVLELIEAKATCALHVQHLGELTM